MIEKQAKDSFGMAINPGDYGFVWAGGDRPKDPFPAIFEKMIGSRYYCEDRIMWICFEKFIPIVIPVDLPKRGEECLDSYNRKVTYHHYAPFHDHKHFVLDCDGYLKQCMEIKPISKTPGPEHVFKNVYYWNGDKPSICGSGKLIQILPSGRFVILCNNNFYQDFEHAEVIK